MTFAFPTTRHPIAILQQPWLYLQPTERVQPRQHLRPNIPGRNVQVHTRRSRNFLRNKLKNPTMHFLILIPLVVNLVVVLTKPEKEMQLSKMHLAYS